MTGSGRDAVPISGKPRVDDGFALPTLQLQREESVGHAQARGEMAERCGNGRVVTAGTIVDVFERTGVLSFSDLRECEGRDGFRRVAGTRGGLTVSSAARRGRGGNTIKKLAAAAVLTLIAASSAAAADREQLPQKFAGDWCVDKVASEGKGAAIHTSGRCETPGSDRGVSISSRGIDFHETKCKVVATGLIPQKSVDYARFLCGDVGEFWTMTYLMWLDGGQLHLEEIKPMPQVELRSKRARAETRLPSKSQAIDRLPAKFVGEWCLAQAPSENVPILYGRESRKTCTDSDQWRLVEPNRISAQELQCKFAGGSYFPTLGKHLVQFTCGGNGEDGRQVKYWMSLDRKGRLVMTERASN